MMKVTIVSAVIQLAFVKQLHGSNLQTKDDASLLSFDKMQTHHREFQNATSNRLKVKDDKDPDCQTGVLDPNMAICCPSDCGANCGESPYCKNPKKFAEAVGIDASKCCKDLLVDPPTCDSALPPCTMKGAFGDSVRTWKDTMAKCDKVTCSNRVSQSLAAHKGDFMVKLYVKGTAKYFQAKAVADKIRHMCVKKIAEAEADKNEGEGKFWASMMDKCAELKKECAAGVQKVKDLQLIAKPMEDIEPLKLKLDTLIADGELILRYANSLELQYVDGAKDYNCTAPPMVKHTESVCTKGDTKYQTTCQIKCAKGFNGEGTFNKLSCTKQGKLGEQLYGEWAGMAACVGKNCGKPPVLENAKTQITDIRHAHAAAYVCNEGFENHNGHSTFDMACNKDGKYVQNKSHVCRPVRCGVAPKLANTKPVPGSFFYTDTAKYTCREGYTIDEMPGGLKSFSTSCQSTATFSQGVGCKRVRCGPPPEFQKTDLKSENAEQFFGDQVRFRCQQGYTLDQKAKGADHFALVCAAHGEFSVDAAGKDVPVPKCSPIAAGMPSEVKNGKYMRTNMFYGDSVLVVADTGYSTKGKPTTGLDFTLTVTEKGTFSGEEEFLPVVCGAPPKVANAISQSNSPKATFGDLVHYECQDGYSSAIQPADAALGSKFTVQCQADSAFTKAPGLGECKDIDDCFGHTCGPHGQCKDNLNNYTCDCDSGFEQRWDKAVGELHCGNIDDCGPEDCGVGKCIDKVNDYECDCPSGYEQVEEFHGKNQSHDSADKTCHPVVCGTPPEVDNGATVPLAKQEEKLFFPTATLYRCDYGYSIDGTPDGPTEFSVECGADTKFSAKKECIPIACPNTPELSDAATDTHSAVFNESVKYECGKGHTIDGTAEGAASFHMVCQATGLFLEPQDGFRTGGWGHGCKKVACGNTQDVPNSHRPLTSLRYEDSVEYECFSGFTLDGQKSGETKFKVECTADGTLTAVKQCLPKICGKPLPVDVLYASTMDEGVVRYPMNTEVVCIDGHSVHGDPNGNKSFVVSCLASGDFEEYDEKRCKPVICGEPPVMPNAAFKEVKSPVANKKRLNYGERAVYQCDTGYTTGGERDAPKKFEVECLASGDFSAPSDNMQCRNVNDCEGHTCGPKGTCVDQIGEAPAYTCRCEEGFHIEMVNGEQICGKDACKQHDCGVGLCTDLVGDYTCTCPSGYFIGEKNGAKTCLPIECEGGAPIVSNGKIRTSHSGTVVFPVTLRYDCDTGYSIDGTPSDSKRSFQTQCRADGQLHGMMGCQKISCGTAHVLPFVQLKQPTSASVSIDYNQEAKYECNEGYTIKGRANTGTTFEVKCQDSGHLTNPEVCEPIKCGAAPAVANTQIAISGDIFYGQELVYQCLTGYTLDGTARGASIFYRHCTLTGDFSTLDDSQSCKPISTDAPTISNAVMTHYAGEAVTSAPARVSYPNGVKYKCAHGYSANGARSGHTTLTARVDSSGSLSPALPSECTMIQFSIRGQVKSARNGESIDGVKVYIDGTTNTATTSNGFFTLNGVGLGATKLVYQKDGLITGKRTVEVAGDMEVGGASDISMSPQMTDKEWRIVLKWGAHPSDLDTYLKFGHSKVWYGGGQASSNGISGMLEHDDTSSYGPETLYLSGIGDCRGGARQCDMRYYVNDYTRTSSMLQEGAEVTLYTGSRVAGNWKIGDCASSVSGDTNWWHVLTIDGKENKIKWSCDMGASAAPSLDLLQHATGVASNFSNTQGMNFLGK